MAEAAKSRGLATQVEEWLAKAQRAIPQYERDSKRQEWMFQRMVAFARVHGERLARLRLADVLAYLEALTRRGEKEWQVLQGLDSICILLSFGCGRLNVRMAEVREQWLERRMTLVQGGAAAHVVGEFESPLPLPSGTIVDRLSRRLRLLHYARRTEEAYVNWWRRFVRFASSKDESSLRPDDAGRFLEYLAVERHVSASTQGQALSALVFVFNADFRKGEID